MALWLDFQFLKKKYEKYEIHLYLCLNSETNEKLVNTGSSTQSFVVTQMERKAKNEGLV